MVSLLMVVRGNDRRACAEYKLAMRGAYKEKAMDFLKSSWQAAALKSLADRVSRCLCAWPPVRSACISHTDCTVRAACMRTFLSWTVRAIMLQGPQEERGSELVQYPTGLPLETLQLVGKQLTHIPADFTPHPDVEKIMERRRGMVEGTESRVDFAFAEMLAFCTLSLRRPTGVHC